MARHGTDRAVKTKVLDLQKEGRRTFRLPLACRLTYSGRLGQTLFVGEGLTIDVSQRGVGVQGNQPVRAGMLLSLCLQAPKDERLLFIEEARVVWAKKHRFGVEMRRLTLKSRLRLSQLLRSAQAAVLSSRHPLSVRVRWT